MKSVYRRNTKETFILYTKYRHPPKLPRKQVIGRFKDSFLRQRQEGLEKFLNRFVCRHKRKLLFFLLLYLLFTMTISVTITIRLKS